MTKSMECLKKSKGRDSKDFKGEFKNPLAVIRAAVDLLSKDPDNREKIKMVCRIISQQALVLSTEVSQGLELEMEHELETAQA